MTNYEYLRFILRTPDGYLTPTGSTQDISDKKIIVFNVYRIGGPFASKESAITNFLEHSTVKFPIEDCKILYYFCPIRESYNCWKCSHLTACKFWNNRSEIHFHEIN